MSVRTHFDNIAARYDYYKKKNWYYYQQIKDLYRVLIPKTARVLEIGCGTGGILADINPDFGVGIDVSPKMAEIAKTKYGQRSNLRFIASAIEDLEFEEPFDYIYMSDVVEHLEDTERTFWALGRFCKAGTIFINNMANPLWESILLLAEKLGLKMPEGPHRRISVEEYKNLMRRHNFHLIEEGYRCLIPKEILFTDTINDFFYRVPLLQKLGFIHWSKWRYIDITL